VEDDVEALRYVFAHVRLDDLNVDAIEPPRIAAGPDKRDDVAAVGEQSPNEVSPDESAGAGNQRAIPGTKS
jgi:hypothetical protein